MVRQCDFTNTDGTVNPRQANQALKANDRGEISSEETLEILDAFDNNAAVGGCSGGRSGLCDFTQSDGSVTQAQARSAEAAALGDRLTTTEASKIQTAYQESGVVGGCAPGSEPEPTPDVSRAEISSINAYSFEPRQLTVEAGVSNIVESGSGTTLSPTVRITADNVRIARKSVTVSPNQTVEITHRESVSDGSTEVCVDIE